MGVNMQFCTKKQLKRWIRCGSSEARLEWFRRYRSDPGKAKQAFHLKQFTTQ